jgi:drug/metabolite transporter (DMT)-like permease
MSLAYLLAIGSAVLYGAGDFTGGLTTRRAGTIPVVLVAQASGMALLALLLPFLPAASPSKLDLLWGAVAGLTGGLGVALLYRALAIGVMSVVAPVTAVCAVAIPVLFALLLGERPMPMALAGIALGIISIILVSQQRSVAPTQGLYSSSPPGRRSGVGLALASGVAIGFFLLSFAQSKSNAGMWPLLVARLVSVSLFGAIAVAGKRSIRMPLAVVALVVLCGILDMIANGLYLLAARNGPLSIVVTLSSLYPASTVLLARIVLSERLSRWQVTGVVCALTAVVLIVNGGR